MTSGFTDDAGDPAINDDVPGDGGAVGDAIDRDALVGDVIDGHTGGGDAIDGDTADGHTGGGDAIDGETAHGDAADADATDDDVVVDRDGSDNAAQAADVNVGDEAPIEGHEADIEEADIEEADIEEVDGPGVRASLEAILLVADEPVPEVLLAQVLERPRGEIDAALRALAAEYTADGRGFDLREIAGGWRFYTREDCAPLVERFVRDGQEVRLTQAALETLAVIAYRQPVSRARVSAVRGVNCDGVIRTLVLRGLVEDSGTDQETGAILYRTTGYFLERLGMASLDDLPDLAPFLPENIEDIEDNERTRA
jgi:segregation and condensation protein B